MVSVYPVLTPVCHAKVIILVTLGISMQSAPPQSRATSHPSPFVVVRQLGRRLFSSVSSEVHHPNEGRD